MYSDMRHPFLALPYTYRNMAVPRELMVDYENGTIYVKNTKGTRDIQIGKNSILNAVTEHINLLKDNVSEDGNDMYKIRSLIKEIEDWKLSMTTSDNNNTVDKLSEIIEKFKGIDAESPTLMQMLENKVDKEDGKGLSTNDFTNELLDKLTNIQDNANKYSHPTSKQCLYEAPIQSVNGRTGAVRLTPIDIGLGNIARNANYYEHPLEKICDAKVVTSVNNKINIVKLDNNDIELDKIHNYAPGISSNISDGDEKYLTPEGGFALIEKTINGDFTHERDSFVIASHTGNNPNDFKANTNYLLTKLKKILFPTGSINSGRSNRYIEISGNGYSRNTGFTTPTFPSNNNGVIYLKGSTSIVFYVNTTNESNVITVELSNTEWLLEKLINGNFRIFATKEFPEPCVCTIKLKGKTLKKIHLQSLGYD